ncbi:MAG: hypothetical protein WCR44_04425 [Verrucomicrobiota bacterium]
MGFNQRIVQGFRLLSVGWVMSWISHLVFLPLMAGDVEGLLRWHAGTCEVFDQSALQQEFESYLAATPVSKAAAEQRSLLLHDCSRQLGPGVASPQDLGKAYQILQLLADDPLDQNRCRNLLRAVMKASSVLSGQKNPGASEAMLLRQKEILSWNVRIEQKQQQLRRESADPKIIKSTSVPVSTPSKEALQLAEIENELGRIGLGGEVSELQVRLELQELALRFLEQGDYNESILAVRFYRGLFADWNPSFRLGQEAMLEIAPEGGKPTLSDLEFLTAQSQQAVSDLLSSCTTLLDGHATIEASRHLMAAFARGGRTLEVISYPESSRGRILHFLQLQHHLHQLLAEKDCEAALAVVMEMQTQASDFDGTSYRASIQASKSLSGIHLAAARRAGQAEDMTEMLKEIKLTEESWPKNPDLPVLVKEFAGSAELKRSSVNEFDRLYAEHRICEIEQQRFLLESALRDLPVRRAQLKEALDEASKIHDGMERSRRFLDLGNRVGAWELAKTLNLRYPDQEKLLALQQEMLSGVEPLAEGLAKAARIEQSSLGVTLGLYLNLQHRYPKSTFADEGVTRISLFLLKAETSSSELSANPKYH